MSVNNSLYCDPIASFGTDAQKERFLRPFASGEKIGCFSLTEPEPGSDATNQTTLARRDGDAYPLGGRKIFVSTRPGARAPPLFAPTPQAKGPRRTHAV